MADWAGFPRNQQHGCDGLADRCCDLYLGVGTHPEFHLYPLRFESRFRQYFALALHFAHSHRGGVRQHSHNRAGAAQAGSCSHRREKVVMKLFKVEFIFVILFWTACSSAADITPVPTTVVEQPTSVGLSLDRLKSRDSRIAEFGSASIPSKTRRAAYAPVSPLNQGQPHIKEKTTC